MIFSPRLKLSLLPAFIIFHYTVYFLIHLFISYMMLHLLPLLLLLLLLLLVRLIHGERRVLTLSGVVCVCAVILPFPHFTSAAASIVSNVRIDPKGKMKKFKRQQSEYVKNLYNKKYDALNVWQREILILTILLCRFDFFSPFEFVFDFSISHDLIFRWVSVKTMLCIVKWFVDLTGHHFSTPY